MNNINHINSFGLNLLPPKHQNTKFHQTYKSSTPPSSVSGLRSPVFQPHKPHEPYKFVRAKPFATKTPKHQISPNLQTFNSSFFGLRSPVFQPHEQNKPSTTNHKLQTTNLQLLLLRSPVFGLQAISIYYQPSKFHQPLNP